MTSNTNFDKVREFHKRFEHPLHTAPQRNIFEEDSKTVDLRIALIEEEMAELKVAMKARDMTEVCDGAADLLYVTYGLFHSFGINADKAFALVHESNMTKLDSCEENAIESCKWLKEHKPEYTPAYRKSGDMWLIYDSVSGKVLKSKFYKAVDLSSLV
jgi:predicted HAD superfamily Cof-like phosphohydrolase